MKLVTALRTRILGAGRLWRAVVVLLALPCAWVVFEAARLGKGAEAFVARELSAVPPMEVALVLGCSPRTADGRPNLFFSTRIRAASALYHAGKVQRLLVSGDNGRPDYDEPSAMRDALVAQGVPAAKITRDFAGFRTLDSVVRAKEVFGLERVIVVSQAFHVERAIFLARAHGLTAYGFAAADVGGPVGLKVRLREGLSRVAAVLDVHVLRSRPRFGGPPERGI